MATMGTTGQWRDAVARVAAGQDGVMTSDQLRQLGVPTSTISGRVRQGTWPRILPGVLLVIGGRPDQHQRERAALLFAGPEAMLTGPTALRRLGVPAPTEGADQATARGRELVHVLVPHRRHLQPAAFLALQRTRRWPLSIDLNGLATAPPARAVADTARHGGLGASAWVVECVRRGLVSRDDLLAELRDGPRQGSAVLRTALQAPELQPAADMEVLIARIAESAGLPPLRWHAPLFGPLGEPVGVPMAWVESTGVVIEPAPADTAAVARQQRFATFGLTVFPICPALLMADPAGQAKHLSAVVSWAARRVCPPVFTQRERVA